MITFAITLIILLHTKVFQLRFQLTDSVVGFMQTEDRRRTWRSRIASLAGQCSVFFHCGQLPLACNI